MKKVIVFLNTKQTLNFDIQEEEIPEFRKEIKKGLRGLMSNPPDPFFWINMDCVERIVIVDPQDMITQATNDHQREET